jgi:hypothetical protein
MIKIPKGKQLKIFRAGKPISNIPFILEDDLSMTLSSKFDSLVGGGKGNLLFNMLGSVSRDITGFGFSTNFSQFGYQQWLGTDPLTMSPTLAFYMGSTDANSAYTEVYKPALTLMSLPLPEEASGGRLIAPGPSVLAAFGMDEKIAEDKIISLEIGNILRINRIIVTRAEPTWSNEVDDKGYPIWVKIQLDITSLSTATVQMLNNSRDSFNQFLKRVGTSEPEENQQEPAK